MRILPLLVAFLFLAFTAVMIGPPHPGTHDPCDPYGNCVSSSVNDIRSNPDGSLYVGDSFSVPVSVTSGQNTSS